MKLEPRELGLAAVLQVTTATSLLYTSILHKSIHARKLKLRMEGLSRHVCPNIYETAYAVCGHKGMR